MCGSSSIVEGEDSFSPKCDICFATVLGFFLSTNVTPSGLTLLGIAAINANTTSWANDSHHHFDKLME